METVLWRAFDRVSVEKIKSGVANGEVLTKKGMVLHHQASMLNV